MFRRLVSVPQACTAKFVGESEEVWCGRPVCIKWCRLFRQIVFYKFTTNCVHRNFIHPAARVAVVGPHCTWWTVTCSWCSWCSWCSQTIWVPVAWHNGYQMTTTWLSNRRHTAAAAIDDCRLAINREASRLVNCESRWIVDRNELWGIWMNRDELRFNFWILNGDARTLIAVSHLKQNCKIIWNSSSRRGDFVPTLLCASYVHRRFIFFVLLFGH